MFTKVIYKMTAHHAFKKDFGLKDQIQRSAVSVMSNIAEGYERDNSKELVRFLLYSKGSIGEVRSLLCAASDLSYITETEFDQTKGAAISISTQLANFVKYLRRRIPAS